MKKKEEYKEDTISEREIDRRNAVFWYFIGVISTMAAVILYVLVRGLGI